MTDPRTISINDYTYSLPEEKIAKYPLPARDNSRLLIYKQGNIIEDTYFNIADHIPGESLIIFNNSKVVEARLLFQKSSGGQIEIFCLGPDERYPDVTTAMQQTGKVWWQCLVGGASKWKHGQVLEKIIREGTTEIILHARYIEKKQEHFIIELSWSPATMSFAEVLHHTGAIPLPPYIKRVVDKSDSERYQTIYAEPDGSVAAPTAGLHFTKNIFNSLDAENIRKDFVTLHVGAGTFKPVKSETMQGHEMHAEFIEVSKETIENIYNSINNTIIAAGTTSLRTIESLYWMGVKVGSEEWAGKEEGGSRQLAVGRRQEAVSSKQLAEGSGLLLVISQWDPYEMRQDISAKDALGNLINWMSENKVEKLVTKTQIIIAPGYKARIAKALITNFHQPQSTLLLLVAALIGADWRKVYDYALQNDFRFLSYGDGSLLWINS